jgi:hypothetical protein
MASRCLEIQRKRGGCRGWRGLQLDRVSRRRRRLNCDLVVCVRLGALSLRWVKVMNIWRDANDVMFTARSRMRRNRAVTFPFSYSIPEPYGGAPSYGASRITKTHVA